MRFTVRRPPNGEVSPCCHRPSGGDVACSVDVGVAPPAVQASHSKTAWLLRFPGATCPHAEQRCDVYAAGICSTRPKALCCNRVTSWPQPLRLIARLSPRFWATPVPGFSRVPRAERVIARTSSSSTLMTSNRRARSVVVFSTQSLRRSLSRAFSLATARFVCTRRFDPRLARASRCCNTVNRFDSPRVRPGACSSSPVDSAADTTTPRSIPTTLQSPGPGIGSGTCANATCHRAARSRVTR